MSTPTSKAPDRLWRALISLEGLSTGDAFGECFFSFTTARYHDYLTRREMPQAEKGSWNYTDDTQMALSIVETLRRYGAIDQDYLAESFASHYEPARGYGPNMHDFLRNLRRRRRRKTWRVLAPAQFNGKGSFGNGSAMRVAPLGAFFADDLGLAVAQARLSAEVTHTHTEAIAGAIAVTVATALACQAREAGARPSCVELIDGILPWLPESEVRDKIVQAREIEPSQPTFTVATILGSGYQVSAQDTVPYVIWCAGQFLDNFEEALWQTASGLGDVDTTCAMVGGIVVVYTGIEKIPEMWLEQREELARWAIEDASVEKPGDA